MIRRIVLQEGESFDERMLNRIGAFDRRALESATAIVDEVRERGDEAVREYTYRFDGIELDQIQVPREVIDGSVDLVDEDFLRSIEHAAAQIRDFHQRQVTQSWFTPGQYGEMLGAKVTPLARVGVYVPGGRAQYPSTVLMDTIPAKVAGVGEVIMCAPPSASGDISPYTLAAAKVAGVDAIYRIGGAQAIAAMAYGTETVPRVDKVVGPGNAFVAAAKKVVSGDVGIDMIAGPSEVLVLADETSDPAFVAIDLMAQAEHDPMASCYLVTTDEQLVDEVERCIEEYLDQSTRADITRTSLENRGLVVICPDLGSALDTANIIAPEHCEVHMSEPLELLGSIRNAGAIFLGPWTPESVGDYVAGPNHTLPTGGTARFSSPLNVEDFIKRSSVISYSYSALDANAHAIETIAAAEGLWSHGRAVSLRLELVEEYAAQMDELDGIEFEDDEPSDGDALPAFVDELTEDDAASQDVEEFDSFESEAGEGVEEFDSFESETQEVEEFDSFTADGDDIDIDDVELDDEPVEAVQAQARAKAPTRAIPHVMTFEDDDDDYDDDDDEDDEEHGTSSIDGIFADLDGDDDEEDY